MKLGVLRETAAGEGRVAQVPESVARLAKAKVEVLVESGAGVAAGYPDAAYAQAGARVLPRSEVLAQAQVLARVQAPDDAELAELKAGQVLVTYLPNARFAAAAARGVSVLAMEKVPRTTRGQAVDALSSQATLAGYKAVLVGAAQLGRLLPMMTTAAGTLTPSRVLVVGAGVAGLQAIATAHRLGGVVYAYDVRAAAKEQVASVGGKFIDIPTVAAAEAKGGYAKELSAEEQALVQATLTQHVTQADLVITTAQVPNRPAPRIVTRAMVEGMKPGAVVVDIAADSGGNCELTRAGETVVTPGGVTILGPRHLAATVPFHASAMYARNVFNLVQLCVKDGALALDEKDEIIDAMLVVKDGTVRQQA